MNTTATAEALQRPTIYPLLIDRVQSTLIDSVFIVIMMFVFAALLDKVSTPPDWIRIALFFGLFGIYEPVCTAFGCTIGNLIKRIRVRQTDNTSARINLLQAFLRYVLKVALGWISFLTIHFNPERRAIHDLAAGSVMIKV
jgi:uncharacterized RDD family membrane protein YckC